MGEFTRRLQMTSSRKLDRERLRPHVSRPPGSSRAPSMAEIVEGRRTDNGPKVTTLSLWTIYGNPDDYPGKHVLRESRASNGKMYMAIEPAAVVDTLEEARAAVPVGLHRMERRPADDSKIVEVWI